MSTTYGVPSSRGYVGMASVAESPGRTPREMDGMLEGSLSPRDKGIWDTANKATDVALIALGGVAVVVLAVLNPLFFGVVCLAGLAGLAGYYGAEAVFSFFSGKRRELEQLTIRLEGLKREQDVINGKIARLAGISPATMSQQGGAACGVFLRQIVQAMRDPEEAGKKMVQVLPLLQELRTNQKALEQCCQQLLPLLRSDEVGEMREVLQNIQMTGVVLDGFLTSLRCWQLEVEVDADHAGPKLQGVASKSGHVGTDDHS